MKSNAELRKEIEKLKVLIKNELNINMNAYKRPKKLGFLGEYFKLLDELKGRQEQIRLFEEQEINPLIKYIEESQEKLNNDLHKETNELAEEYDTILWNLREKLEVMKLGDSSSPVSNSGEFDGKLN